MLELLAAATVLFFAGSLAAIALRRRSPGSTRLAGLVPAVAALTVAVIGAAAAVHRIPAEPPAPSDLPLQAPGDEEVGSATCRSCHPREHATWRASYHRRMTQTASPESVLGDFGDARVEYDGSRYRLFERDGQFFGEISPPPPLLQRGDGAQSIVLPLKQTTGSHHMQIYWFPLGGDRALESFPLIYFREQERWIPRLAAFITPPDDAHTSTSTWNYTCIGCHTTRPLPRLSGAGTGRIDSRVTELGIACEACHGPGRAHAEANRSPAARYRLHASADPDPTIVNPSRLSHVRSAQVCGQCHAVKAFYSAEDAIAWGERGLRFRPGEDLEAAVGILWNGTFSQPFADEIRRDFPEYIRGSFWDDGTVRVTGREYNALLEAPCFQRGELSCLSCHALHQRRDDDREPLEWANDQLAPGMDGQQACVQCHTRFEEAGVVADHTHHAATSSGSECQNCHMPHTTYGLLKAIRAHDIRNPTLAKTADRGQGRPNACNLCHLDRPLAWTADLLHRWYGQGVPDLSEDDRQIAAGARWALEGDAGLRALVAWSMGWGAAQDASGSGWVVPYLAQLMEDPYDAVRIIAYRSLKTLPGYADVPFDELASPERRAEAVGSLRARWAENRSPTPDRTATLLLPNGRLDEDSFARLLSQRDDRPLNLAE